jgi:hypothetical protein
MVFNATFKQTKHYLLKVVLNTIKQTNKTLSVESGIKHHQQTNKTLSVESGIKHHQQTNKTLSVESGIKHHQHR